MHLLLYSHARFDERSFALGSQATLAGPLEPRPVLMRSLMHVDVEIR